MRKNGFTLTELIAVIAIVGMLAIIAITAVAPLMVDSKTETKEMTISNLEDAATTYAMEKLFISNSCAITTLLDESNVNSASFPNGCTQNKVKIGDLISLGYFKDDSNITNHNGEIVVYKYKEKKGKSALDCYKGDTFIDKAECYNYNIKTVVKKSLVAN